ncbi:KH domain-containing protein [Candidatus Saccharibacteria bacterium]|nr:KH domain-containing protein [Candidatus Saccharibacteria bacterium]
MTSIDQQFIEYIVKSLVSRPDDVIVERSIDEKGVLLVLTVHPEDLGRVIGRRGTTAQSLRTLLRALGTKNDARYNLKIVDTDNLGEGGEAGDGERQGRTAYESDAAEAEPGAAVEEPSKLAAKTRKELADLDDLDI